MDANRRNFLKMTGGLVASMGLPMLSSFPGSAQAAGVIPSNPKKLVILHLDGGNDGVNTIIPIDSTQHALYASYRPTIGIPMASTLPVGFDASGIEFGLHPAMASLMPYQSKLALFPATHTGVDSNRSHFFQHDMLDAGLYKGLTALDRKGWLGRYLDSKYITAPGGIVAQDFGANDTFVLRGDTFVLRFPNPAQQDLGTGSTIISDAIWADMKIVTPGASGTSLGQYSFEQQKVFDEILPRLRTVNFTRYPGAGVTYPTGLGTRFKQTADMLFSLPEIEVVHVLQGGYDTHANQGGVAGQQANILKEMADSLAAFYADLSLNNPAMVNNVAVVVMSEFGRTVKENVDAGTDHGQATSWMVFGGGIIGGVYGRYPGLEPANMEPFSGTLAQRDWLSTTIDYRDIFSELVGPKFIGASVAQTNALFPGYNGAVTPLNFI